MSEPRISTDIYVSATIRTAAKEGVPITVIRRGDLSSGSIILKINLLNGTARVLIEARYSDAGMWIPATASEIVEEGEADAYMNRQADIDPDAWLIEIEDKKGRIWFSGNTAP